MKIGMVHLNLSTESGDPRMFYMIAREFAALGHRVVVYTAAYDPAAFADIHRDLDIRVVPAPEPLGTASAAETNGIINKINDRMRYLRAARRAADAILPAL